MKRLFIFLAFLSALPTITRAQIEVAKYYNNCKGAVSYTFDDGMIEHYTLLFPELKQRGIKGTFAINGAFIGGKWKKSKAASWAQLREMAADGQELSNHAWKHRKLTKLSYEEMRMEVQRNDTLIYDSAGVFPRTFIYPYNSKNDMVVELCSKDRVGTRTQQVSVGSKRDSTWLRQWVDGLVEKGEWGIGMTHGITFGYDSIGTDPSRFWKHLDYVCTIKDRLWVATFHDVSAYVAERDNIKLDIKKSKKRTIITPKLTLDKKLFNHPLTLVIETDKPIKVKQDGKRLETKRVNNRVLVNFNPNGGRILLSL